jgi:DeoR/GlpR family transcriptional regulator of sugar metabolism
MFIEERHKKIVEIVESKSRVTVKELAEEFNLNSMTIRRDFFELEKKGLLQRVHGGAICARGRSYEPPFIKRSTDNLEAKQKIGRKAAEYIHDGDSIALDVGTTTIEIAENLKGKTNLTILTPSIRIAQILADNPNIRIICTGGILRPNEHSLIGDLAIATINNFYVDLLFLGMGGIDFAAGLTEYNLDDAQIKKALIKNAKEVILVADSSKFKKVAFTFISPIKVINRIITDSKIDNEVARRIKEVDIELIIAD